MRRYFHFGFQGVILCGVLFWMTPGATSQSPEAAREQVFQTKVRPLTEQYCIGCHNEKSKTAGIGLDNYQSAASVGEESGIWEKVLRKLRTGEMPPAGMPRPKPADSEFVQKWLEAELDRAASLKPNPGHVSIHRLNRAEYNNAVRDVLGVDFTPADDFPPDDAGYGFDNIADVLSMPPVLMEKYMSAANKVSRNAVGNVKIDPFIDKTTIDRRESQTERISDLVPFGTRGGAMVKHRFPLDAEYLIRVRLRGDVSANLHPVLDFRVDGQRVKTSEVRFSAAEEDEDKRRVEIRTPVKSGTRDVVVTFLRESTVPEDPEPALNAKGKPVPKSLAVDFLEIGGPFNPKGPGDTLSRRRIFTCKPGGESEEEPCARQILARLSRSAYRRPVSSSDVDPLVGIYRLGRKGSGTFEGGVQLAIKALLVSPNFLFRLEQDPRGAAPGSTRALTDVELASRLSFFLWSSVPDEQLLAVAEKGELHQPDVLAAQVKRMLGDAKSSALVANFAGQWLQLRNLNLLKPDPEVFPDFDEELRRSELRETQMFFEYVIKDDRSVLDFLDGKYTFLNERLARHYGIPGVHGKQFRKVDLDGTERSGVLTQASILTVSSYPTRTSPVIRGKWILENLMGAPPPPPPPNVPELKTAGIGQDVSLRQRLEAHRANPVCASCHARMDPLGFALENYDAVGRWRTKEGSFPIDASGKLANGATFTGPQELKATLRTQKDEFVLCLTEKLMTYAVGRGLERYDKAVIRTIARDLAANDFKFSTLVMGIVKSAPFKMRDVVAPVGNSTAATIAENRK